jgi:hypothetical protein
MENLVQDVRYGFRSLLRNRGFLLVAMLTISFILILVQHRYDFEPGARLCATR